MVKTYNKFHPTQLQMQQHRLIKINQDLRHRVAVIEAQGKALIQQKVELEAAAQAQQQDLVALQLEASRLRKEIQSLELEREIANIVETSPVTSGTWPLGSDLTAPSTLSRQESSVWAECGADHDFLADAFEQDEDLSFPPESSSARSLDERSSDDEKSREMFLVKLLLYLGHKKKNSIVFFFKTSYLLCHFKQEGDKKN